MTNFHLDGSELSWLVYADYLDDNNKDGSFIRESIENFHIFTFDCEIPFILNSKVGTPTAKPSVGAISPDYDHEIVDYIGECDHNIYNNYIAPAESILCDCVGDQTRQIYISPERYSNLNLSQISNCT